MDASELDSCFESILHHINCGLLSLANHCLSLGVRPFDGVIDEGALCDSGGRNKYPIKQYEEGCYCFLEISGNTMRPLYVGKAKRITNRMQSHYQLTDNWLAEWGEGRGEGLLLCVYWLDKNRAALESQLITALHPVYNKRFE
jgi:hypothetical protein